MNLLFDFACPGSEQAWQAVDDRVMGGRSRSAVRRLDAATVAFAGHMTQADGGGFASVHAQLRDGLPAECNYLRLRCMGDGRRYSLRLRQRDDYDGISYRCDFTSLAGCWQDVVLALEDFTATFRGRDLPTAQRLQARRVERIGLLLAGGQTGDFLLALASIETLVQVHGHPASELK